MLTREDDIDVHALRRQGWTITAIARHLGRDRKTIRAYLAGDREAGVRARSTPGPFEVFAPYCAQRLADDPHLWASTLFDELTDLGYLGSYPTMTRQIRTRGLRPACEPCRPATGRSPRVRIWRVIVGYDPPQPRSLSSSNRVRAHRCGSSARRCAQYGANTSNGPGVLRALTPASRSPAR